MTLQACHRTLAPNQVQKMSFESVKRRRIWPSRNGCFCRTRRQEISLPLTLLQHNREDRCPIATQATIRGALYQR